MQTKIKVEPLLEAGWMKVLEAEFQKDYFIELKNFLLEEKKKYVVYPPGKEMFSAFHFTPFDKVKVVILGQDPYHGPGQAHGLSFSVPRGVRKPPSLLNIFKELRSDLGIEPPVNGTLISWARQGVLLLNATLSVRANQAGSHQKKGWELFTNQIIKTLSEEKQDLVFLLWGNYAQAKSSLINSSKHKILTAVHPSPLSASRGFFGCRHFSKTNEFLESKGLKPIDWEIDDFVVD